MTLYWNITKMIRKKLNGSYIKIELHVLKMIWERHVFYSKGWIRLDFRNCLSNIHANNALPQYFWQQKHFSMTKLVAYLNQEKQFS